MSIVPGEHGYIVELFEGSLTETRHPAIQLSPAALLPGERGGGPQPAGRGPGQWSERVGEHCSWARVSLSVFIE